MSSPQQSIPRLYAAASLKRVPVAVAHGVRHLGIPRLYAAASLKLDLDDGLPLRALDGIPRLYAAASLKPIRSRHLDREVESGIPRLYAAASLKHVHTPGALAIMLGIPRLYAAASLKRGESPAMRRGFSSYSAALCRGLIEASKAVVLHVTFTPRYSAALCRGLIEAPTRRSGRGGPPDRIPRLYAAASLKRVVTMVEGHAHRLYSAALCRGLIEAERVSCYSSRSRYVFRGFMPRPH